MSRPRAARSVATSAVNRPDFKPSTAAVRCCCVRSACSAAVRMPCAISRDASRSAPIFVRTKTSTGPASCLRNFASHACLLAACHHDGGVVDRPGGAVPRAALDHPRVAGDGARAVHDLVRHRRREEQRLTRCGQLRQDAGDVGPEAHVHHPVRLVQHQHDEAGEVGDRPTACGPSTGRAWPRRCRRRPGAPVPEAPPGRRRRRPRSTAPCGRRIPGCRRRSAPPARASASG